MSIVLLLVGGMKLQAQEINVGVGTILPTSFNLSSPTSKTFYFSDDVNSQYTLNANEQLQNRTLMSPQAFVNYRFNNHFFCQYELAYLSLIKTEGIVLNNDLISSFEYDVQYEFAFFNQFMSVGYIPFRNKEVQPFISIGLNYQYNNKLTEVSNRSESSYLENQDPHGKVLDSQIKSLRTNNFLGRLEVGFDYYLLHVSASYMTTIGSIENEVYSPHYKRISSFLINTGLTLFSGNIKSKKFKNYIKLVEDIK